MTSSVSTYPSGTLTAERAAPTIDEAP